MNDEKPAVEPDWVYPLQLALHLIQRGEANAALLLLDKIAEDLPDKSSGLKWVDHRRDLAKARLAGMPKRPPAPWVIPSRLIEHSLETGFPELALDLISLLESALEPKSSGHLWVRMLRLRAHIQIEGVADYLPEIDAVLASTINATAKDKLRLLVVQTWPENGDLTAFRVHLDALMRPDAAIGFFQAAIPIAVARGIYDGAKLFEMADPTPLYQIEAGRARVAFGPDERVPTAFKSTEAQQERVRKVETFEISDCKVVTLGQRSFFFDGAGRLVSNVSSPVVPPDVPLIQEMLTQAEQMAPTPGVSIYLNDPHIGSNYCHWLVDYLPRLHLLAQPDGAVDTILCKPLRNTFERDSLSFVGFGDVPLLEHGPQHVSRLERLRVGDLPSRNFAHPMVNCSPELLGWWRAKLDLSAAPKRRFYIVRDGKRGILNHDALWGVLEAHGFEAIRAETLTFQDQVALFAEASAIIGGHGAGLTNILFAPDSCKVLELFPHRGGTAAFFCLADAIGQTYRPLVAQGPKMPSSFAEPNNLSFSAPLPEVQAWLETL